MYEAQLRRNAHITDELDVELGLADVIELLSFSRSFRAFDGRHPVGLLSSATFTPTVVSLCPDSQLSQTSSFVPADYAEVGIVDHLISRVGAKVDMFHDRNTFMVEMLDVLKKATPISVASKALYILLLFKA